MGCFLFELHSASGDSAIWPRHENAHFTAFVNNKCANAYASAQSDQHICCSLPKLYNGSLVFHIRNFKPVKCRLLLCLLVLVKDGCDHRRQISRK